MRPNRMQHSRLPARPVARAPTTGASSASTPRRPLSMLRNVKGVRLRPPATPSTNATVVRPPFQGLAGRIGALQAAAAQRGAPPAPARRDSVRRAGPGNLYKPHHPTPGLRDNSGWDAQAWAHMRETAPHATPPARLTRHAPERTRGQGRG